MQASSTASPHVRVLIDVWFSFQIIGGHVLVPILIATFLLTKAKRDATLINLGVTLTLSSIFNCLLSVVPRVPPQAITHPPDSRLYADQYVGPEPNRRLCIFQAAAFGASAPMFVPALTPLFSAFNAFTFSRWSIATLTLVSQMRSRVELKTVRCLVAVRLSFAQFDHTTMNNGGDRCSWRLTLCFLSFWL
jgi:hypothetical protein